MQLMITDVDGRILNWGTPPWRDQDTLSGYTILEIDEQSAPPGGLHDYRYVNNAFVHDPLPPPAETVRRTETQTRFQQLTQGLGALSTEDRSYAITARIMAYKDGATNPTILGITNKATATAYVTGKSEWTAATAATRNLVADVLETIAGIVQVALLTLE